MTAIDRTPKKGLVLPNKNRLSQGQLFIAKGNNIMSDGSQLAALERLMRPKIGRDGRVQKHAEVNEPAIAFGMKSQTRPGGVHPHLHGQAINDEVDDKLHIGKGNVPTHSGMRTSPKSNAGDRLRGTHDRGVGSRILDEAARLGRPKK